jgi:hypothetical protein
MISLSHWGLFPWWDDSPDCGTRYETPPGGGRYFWNLYPIW